MTALAPEVPFAIVAFGRLGGAELGYASDLDLAFVHRGTDPIDAEEAERVATGLLRFLGGATPAERIWAVDATLRPEGRNGPLARSLEAWHAYLGRWASTWERQAYLRVRAVAGDEALGQALVAAIGEAVWARPFGDEDVREVRRMKVRIERERLAPGEDPEFHLKLGRGSLSDIEFTAQLLQLRHGVTGARTLGALDALVEGGHLPAGEADVLAEAVPVLRADAEPELPRGRPRGLLAAAPRASHPAGAVARLHRRRPARGVPPGHPPSPADRGAAVLRPRVKGSSSLREDDGALCRGAGAEGGFVPLHPQVKTLLDGLAAAGGPALDTVPPEQAREMFSQMSGLEQREEVARVDDRLVPGADGDIPVRVYTPVAAVGAEPSGVLLWLHGGGWVIGDLESADATARMLANRSGAVVVSVDYRLAPEHKAPAALEDCLAALVWTVENAELLGVTAAKVAVGGDSAGGNLAALLCHRVRDEFGPQIDFQLLVYPVTDCTLGHPSIEENADGYFLTKAAMVWFVGHYLGETDPKDPTVSPLYADRCDGLPPALVITAEFDPLRDEGEAYAQRLREAGVVVQQRRFDGQIHGFFGLTTFLEDGAAAMDLAGATLREALA